MGTYQIPRRFFSVKQDSAFRAIADPWFWCAVLLTGLVFTVVAWSLGIPTWIANLATVLLCTFVASNGVAWSVRKISVWRRMRVLRKSLV